MATKQTETSAVKEPTFSEVFTAIAEKSQQVMQAYLENDKLRTQLESNQVAEMTTAYQDLFLQFTQDPKKVVDAQRDWFSMMSAWMSDIGKHWLPSTQHASDGGLSFKDKRFCGEAWETDPYYRYIYQSYLLICQQVMSFMEELKQKNDNPEVEQLAFFAERFLDAYSPANFLFTNPELIDITLKTQGQNLIDGLENFKKDIARARVNFQISMTESDAFEVGKNIATTEGDVIFQNDVMQIIQYKPTTGTVHPTPLLIVPPWINKYYVLDLSEKNSLVKYCVDQGMTTFIISWVNPTPSHRHLDFEDYVQLGPLTAIDVVTKQCGVSQVNALSYCNGGTLLATTLAYMAKQKDTRVKSATYMATLIDFSDPGEVGVFINEEQIQSLEQKMEQSGYLDGSYVSSTFNILRANDLIWSFYINNYLKGQKPAAFDLLYWNCDCIHLAQNIYSTYLRNFYLNNELIQSNQFTVKDTPIDVADISIPSYFISTEKDHIAPWKTTFNGFIRHGGKKQFVLGQSGHIAGIVNPAGKEKYGHYYDGNVLSTDPDQWLAGAKFQQTSWWPHWMKWLKSHAGKVAKPQLPTPAPYKRIEAAPGSYVKVSMAEAAAS